MLNKDIAASLGISPAEISDARLLVIVDTLRMGRMREREIAIVKLDKAIEKYGQNES